MPLVKNYTQMELETELAKVSKTPQGTEAAITQAQSIVETLQSDLGMSEKDAKLAVLGKIKDAAEEDGGSLEAVIANYPVALREYLHYTPEDLERNQNVTVAGTSISAVLFLASFAFGAFAVIRAIRLGASALPALYKMLRNPRAQGQLANALSILKIEVGRSVALLGVTMGFTTALGWLASTFVNNWNDVFHWGPQNAEQQALTIAKDLSKGTFGTGASSGTGQPGGGFAPSLTTTRTAKPKIFLGVVYAGRVADTPDFVRHVDDAITSDEDLKDDIEINLASWLATMADRLNYEIQVKFEPYDLDNVRKPGYWLTMALYYSGKGGKRIFIDEILLGPFDNKAYYPTTQVTDSIRRAIDAATIPDILKPDFGSSGQLLITTKEGEKISVFPPTQTSAPAKALPESAPESIPAPTSAPATASGPCAATTLYEYFSAEGRSLPSHSIIAAVYAENGLGTAESYIGSAEQNTRILAVLKQKRGCPVSAPIVAQPAPSAPAPVPVAPSSPVAPAPAPSTFVSPLQQFFPSLPSSPPPAPAPSAPVLTTRQMRTNTGSVTLNLRSAPSLSASVVASLPNGTSLVVSTTEIVADGYTWVATVAPSRAGYVAKEFLLPA